MTTCMRMNRFALTILLVGLLSPVVDAAVMVPGSVTGLMVGLDGSSVLSSGGAVQVWYDQIGATAADQQDYGVAPASARSPALVNVQMPNNTFHDVVDFTPAAAPNSDYLFTKSGGTARTTVFGDAFTSGADAAYDNPTGLTWILVLKNENAALGSRSFFRGDYASPANSTVDIGSFMSGSGFGVNARRDDNTTSNNQITSISNVNDWYIMGGVLDLAADTLQGKLLRQDQTAVTFPVLPASLGTTTYGAHILSTLGSTSAGGSSQDSQAMDGKIAEYLIFNKALSDTEYAQVQSYLNNKYFVPEPSAYVLAGFGLIGIASMRRIWRKKLSKA
jgi:hypothetical protein